MRDKKPSQMSNPLSSTIDGAPAEPRLQDLEFNTPERPQPPFPALVRVPRKKEISAEGLNLEYFWKEAEIGNVGRCIAKW